MTSNKESKREAAEVGAVNVADALTSTLNSLIARVEANARKKEADLSAAGFPPEKIAAISKESCEMTEAVAAEHDESTQRTKPSGKRRGVSTTRLIKQAQLKLFEGEQRGRYIQYLIDPGSEFPSIFTRVPIFVPGQRGTAKAMLDNELAMHFETGWGKGRKFGPPLTIYDEDTLLALGALRQRQLHGMGQNMPVQVMNPFDPKEETDVQVLFTTISDIEEYLGNKKGGRGHKKRLASVKRLAAVTLEFSKISDPNLKSIIQKRTINTKLIDMVTEELSTDSCLYIQFPPMMVRWLRESYTYIDMDIRRQIPSDTGKAIHKHLASQSTFNIFAETLRKVTGSHLERPKFLKCLRNTLVLLEGLGWLEYELEGNGRRLPFKLTGRRTKRTT